MNRVKQDSPEVLPSFLIMSCEQLSDENGKAHEQGGGTGKRKERDRT